MARRRPKSPLPEGAQLIAENRRARRDYEIADVIECGLELRGTEVKSLRDKNVNFADAYALSKDGELFLIGLAIAPFRHGTHENHESDRTRKLLLHRREITRLEKEIQQKGATLVPLMLYFKKGWAKCLLGVARGKSQLDKRETIKRRQADREMERAMKRGRR